MPAATKVPLATVVRMRLAALRLGRRLRRQSGTGLTPSQESALSALERHGSMRIGRLAEHEQIGKSTVTRLVANLEALGLIRRRPDTEDGRTWWVDLTDRGHELLAESTERANAYLAMQLEALSPADQRHLLAAVPALERLLEVKR